MTQLSLKRNMMKYDSVTGTKCNNVDSDITKKIMKEKVEGISPQIRIFI
jgi:hypothetical protein